MNISTTYCYSQSLRFRFTVYLFIIGLLSIFSLKLHAQEKPRSYIIAGISVEGNTYADAQTIISISGLRIGEEIKIYRAKDYSKNEFFFDYLKSEIKEKRKMGHLTIIKS